MSSSGTFGDFFAAIDILTPGCKILAYFILLRVVNRKALGGRIENG
jgi:hypothetical protein